MKKNTAVMDATGREVTNPKLLEAFSRGSAQFRSTLDYLGLAANEIESLLDSQFGAFLLPAQIQAQLANLNASIVSAQPHAPCPFCGSSGCRACRQTGWVTKFLYDTAPEQLKG